MIPAQFIRTTEVIIGEKTYQLHRVNNDVYGNPRYVIHFLALGLSDYNATKLTRKCGLSIYRAKWFGGGFVFQSYNVTESIKFFETTLNIK